VCAECDDSLPFSEASSISLCYVLFPATLLHQLLFHPVSPHLAIYFFIYLSVLLFPNSYIIPFREFCFLPFCVHAQTIVISLTLLYEHYRNIHSCSSTLLLCNMHTNMTAMKIMGLPASTRWLHTTKKGTL